MKSNADVETLRKFALGIQKVHGLDGTTINKYAMEIANAV
jgi:hypothetical protein